MAHESDKQSGNPGHSGPAEERGAEGIDRRRFLERGVVAIAGTTLLARSPHALAATGPLPDGAAATVMDGLIASVKATSPARIKVRAWPTADPSRNVESSWQDTNRANAAEITLRSAAGPGKQWSWQAFVQDQDGEEDRVADVVRTLPARPAPGLPSSFTFAFGCCAIENPPAPTLRIAKAQNPLFFAMIGDMGYRDKQLTGQHYEGYAEMFRKYLVHPDFTPIFNSMPFYGMQDDHDYGLDECWADTVKDYAGEAYADLMPGVRWPDRNYRRWTVGQAEFFLLDNRRYRDNPKGPFENGKYMSVMRSAQRAWLLNGLASSPALVKFVFAPMTMTYYWGSAEKKEVRDFINANVSGPVIFLTGDRHAGVFSKFPNQIWEMLASPLKNSSKTLTPAREGVIWTENGAGPGLSNCVGIVEVDTLASRRVTLRLLREDGAELHREIVPLS